MSPLHKHKIKLILFIITIFTLTCNAQEAIVTIEQEKEIKNLLDKRKQLLTNGSLKSHYSIQVISGNLETARETLKDCKNKYPETKSNIVYDEPYYKVRVGEYRNQLEADKNLLTINEEYPGAFIFKPKNK